MRAEIPKPLVDPDREVELQTLIATYVDELRHYRDVEEDRCEAVRSALNWFSPYILREAQAHRGGLPRAIRRIVRGAKRRPAVDPFFPSVLKEFAAWLEGKAKPLTDKRVSALARLATQCSLPPPSRRDVKALLAAPDVSSADGLRDEVAMGLVAGSGLSAADLCELEVGDVDLAAGTILVPGDPARRLHLCAELYHDTVQLIEGQDREAPLFATLRREPLRSRYLQQRVARHVKRLGDALGEPLTLERLRDHAARALLGDGYTLDDVGEALGHTQRSVTHRRFGGEVWAYLADHDANWFTLEAAAQAEEAPLAEAQQWLSAGMRHERRGEQVFVRKEDIRAARDAAKAAADREKQDGAAPEPPSAREAVERMLFATSADEWSDAFQQALEVVDAPTVSLAEKLDELDGNLSAAFLEFRRLRKSRPELTASDRVQEALGHTLPAGLRAESETDGLRSALMGSTLALRFLENNVGSIDFNQPGLIWQSAVSQLHSPQGMDMLQEALQDPSGQAAFWLLVDRHLDRLEAGLQAATALYGLKREVVQRVGVGCLLYSFFAGVVAASPAVHVDRRWSAREPETILWEAFSHWLLVTLHACGALRTDHHGNLWNAPWSARIGDVRAFVAEIEKRWEASCRYRRGPCSFDALPIVFSLDLARYAAITYSRVALGKREVVEEMSGRLLYLTKLPPARLLLPPQFLNAPDLKWIVYLAYVPLLRSEFRQTIARLCDAKELHAQTAVAHWPPDLPETCLHLVDLACEGFSFWYRTGQTEKPCCLAQAARRFAGYLGKAVRREFQRSAAKVVEALEAGEYPDEAGAPEEEQKPQARPVRTSPARGGDPASAAGAEDDTDYESTWLSPDLLRVHVIWGDDNMEYITVPSATRRFGFEARWLQRHVGALGGVRVGEVVSELGRLLDEELTRDAFLLPYDSYFRQRVLQLRADEDDVNELK